MDARAKEIIDLGDRLFTKKEPMNTLWQEIAEHFFVERADFVDQYVIGEDFARHLEDSYPCLIRRELGNSISSMLRPRDTQWFKSSTLDDQRDEDPNNAHYLEHVVNKMRRLMYDSRTQLVRATKEGDHDFVTFGQAVISVEESATRDHLYYRAHHLRDCAWLENQYGEVDHLHRRMRMTARQMTQRFGNKCHRTIHEAAKKAPNTEFNVRCIVMPKAEYDFVGKGNESGNARWPKPDKLDYVVIYVDVSNCIILKEGKMPDFPYVVPRWQTIPGFQYAYSPASAIALPDARMIQQMARIILEAGEKAVDPPVVAVEEAVREVNLAAGAITWADLSFDGKLREAVQPISIESNMQVAFAMRTDMRDMLQKAWFIDRLQMPSTEGADQMTAREVSVRQQEFVRNLLPLFEPIEVEYNTKLLDKSFMLLRNLGEFPEEEVPEDLRGEDIIWNFESPVQEGAQRVKTSQYMETLEIIMASAQLGLPAPPIDMQEALLDAIRGTSAPGDWFLPDDEVEEQKQQDDAQSQADQQVANMSQILGLAQQAGDAGKAIGEAENIAAQPQGQGNAAPPPQVQPAGPGGSPVINPPNIGGPPPARQPEEVV